MSDEVVRGATVLLKGDLAWPPPTCASPIVSMTTTQLQKKKKVSE